VNEERIFQGIFEGALKIKIQKSIRLAERIHSEMWLTRKANRQSVDAALEPSFPRLI